MNIDHYTYLLANPQKITSDDVSELNNVIQKFPYFQSARALQLKGLKTQGSYSYNEALKLTAAHTTDRDILFQYITSEKFAQNEISQNILQHDISITDIKVISENVSEQIEREEEENYKVEKQKAADILNPDLFQRKIDSVTTLIENKESSNPETHEEKEIILDPDKPLEFTKGDTYSFSEWLKLTKAKPIERQEEKTEKILPPDSSPEVSADERDRKFELIDRFIQERPKIIPDSPSSESTEKPQKGKATENSKVAIPYTQGTDSLMTETLAKVYLQQKNYKKAIQAYKILILKNPEKSGFFADQIRAIEKLINPEAQ